MFMKKNLNLRYNILHNNIEKKLKIVIILNNWYHFYRTTVDSKINILYDNENLEYKSIWS